MSEPLVTIITPTTGRESLFHLIESITKQGVPVHHILLWDDNRDGRFNQKTDLEHEIKLTPMEPADLDKKEYWEEYNYKVTNVLLKGSYNKGIDKGSALRAIGLMVADTDMVTFADDDVIWEKDHLVKLMESLKGRKWAHSGRKIWVKIKENAFECLGVPKDLPISHNCILFLRRFGVSAACIYRESEKGKCDESMSEFLQSFCGDPGVLEYPTVNQTCPTAKAIQFKKNCVI